MNVSPTRIIVAACATAAVAAPVAAQAKPGHGHGREHAAQQVAAHRHHVRMVNVIASGTVDSVDGNVVTFTVKHGNRPARSFKGQQVQVDVTNARVRVHDVNGDGSRDAADVAAGDRVAVQLRVPRRAPDLTQPFAARRFLDVGPAPAPGSDG